MMLFIDGDFKTDTPCKYHCSPSCHPGQVGPEWVYGCNNKAWPPNRAGDFVPIVMCDGIQSKCEIPKKYFRDRINGLKRRITNRKKAVEQYKKEIVELIELERTK